MNIENTIKLVLCDLCYERPLVLSDRFSSQGSFLIKLYTRSVLSPISSYWIWCRTETCIDQAVFTSFSQQQIVHTHIISLIQRQH